MIATKRPRGRPRLTEPTAEHIRFLAAVVEMAERQGYSPTHREISAELRIGLSRVAQLGNHCRRMGLLTLSHHHYRRYRLTEAGRALLENN